MCKVCSSFTELPPDGPHAGREIDCCEGMATVLLTYQVVRSATNGEQFKFTSSVKEKERRGEKKRASDSFFHLQVKTENKTTDDLKNNSFRTERSAQQLDRLEIASKESTRPVKYGDVK